MSFHELLIKKNKQQHNSKSLSNELFEQDYVDTEVIDLQQETYINDRNKSIHQISKDVDVVNGIFKDVKTLIGQQQPLIDNIELNLENTNKNTDKAVKEIEKADQYDKKSKKSKFILGSLTTIGTIILLIILI